MTRAAILLLVPATLWAADPDAIELGRKSMPVVAANSAKARQYAFREYYVNRQVDAKGKETDRATETWDVIGLEGSLYGRLILRNDKPLSAKEQRREDQRQADEAERRRKETPEQRRNRLFSFTYSYRLPYERLTEIFDLRYIREKESEGRRCYLLEVTPKADFQPSTDNDKETVNYKFVFWLEAENYYPARIDGEIIGEHSRMQKGTTFTVVDQRLVDGTWAPKTNTIHFAVRFMKVHTVHGEAVRTYSDFHKFQADSTIQFTDKIEQWH